LPLKVKVLMWADKRTSNLWNLTAIAQAANLNKQEDTSLDGQVKVPSPLYTHVNKSI